MRRSDFRPFHLGLILSLFFVTTTLLAQNPYYVTQLPEKRPAVQSTAPKQLKPPAIPVSQPDPLAEPAIDPESPEDILDLDITQLGNVDVSAPSLNLEVSSVERSTSTVGKSAAAIFVITDEMIRRSGARTIPDILRMAPGVQVAQITVNKYAISIRGFNSKFSNKLLVQIDGVVIYDLAFSGVWWDSYDIPLADISRIEVIRGPGATIWGANAVNGIINIITKNAKDTQGGYLTAGTGTERSYSTARYGGKIGDDAHYRMYGKWYERDAAFGNANDDTRFGRGGFRMDWKKNCTDHVTVQGDYYEGISGERITAPTVIPPSFTETFNTDDRVRGGNALFRFTRKIDDQTDWSLQTYYHRYERNNVNSQVFNRDTIDPFARDTIDVDFQARIPVGEHQQLTWGARYRFTEDFWQDPANAPNNIVVSPNSRADDLFSYFVQDRITLVDDHLYFIVGSKFDHNDYSGFEFQPTARILITPDEKHTIWGSISRAVRTPSRGEDDAFLITTPPVAPGPIFGAFQGSRGFEAEDVLAFEVGARAQPNENFFWDLAVFYNDYDDLLATVPSMVPVIVPPGAIVFPASPINGAVAQSYGFELTSSLSLTDSWRVQGSYSFLRLVSSGVPGAIVDIEGNDPRNQFYGQSSWDLGCNWEFDLIGRYVDNLPNQNIPRYTEMDARLAWKPLTDLEVFLVGRNLLDKNHPEYPGNGSTGETASFVQREVYAGFTWAY